MNVTGLDLQSKLESMISIFEMRLPLDIYSRLRLEELSDGMHNGPILCNYLLQ